MATKTLTLDALLPDQTPAKGTRFTVTVDRDVAIKDTGVIAKKGSVLGTLTVAQDGTFPTLAVTPNDDDSLQDWSKGYRLLIAAEQTPLGGITDSWVIAVTTADEDNLRLSTMPTATPVTVGSVDIGDGAPTGAPGSGTYVVDDPARFYLDNSTGDLYAWE